MTQTFKHLRAAADLLGKLTQARLGYKMFEEQEAGQLYVPPGMDKRVWERNLSVGLIQAQKRAAWQEHIKTMETKLEAMGYVDET